MSSKKKTELHPKNVPDHDHPGPGSEVEYLDLPLHVGLSGEELGQDCQVVVGALNDELDEEREGHLRRPRRALGGLSRSGAVLLLLTLGATGGSVAVVSIEGHHRVLLLSRPHVTRRARGAVVASAAHVTSAAVRRHDLYVSSRHWAHWAGLHRGHHNDGLGQVGHVSNSP